MSNSEKSRESHELPLELQGWPKRENRRDVHHPLDFEPVESGQGDSVAYIPLVSLDSALPASSSISLSLSPQPFSLYFSFREAVREPIFPRNVRIPTWGRNREGNSIGALFYKYLSSFESIGDRVLHPSSPPFSLTRSCSRPLPVFEAKLPGVYLFLQIFYTFPTRICIHNCHGRPEPALSSRLYFSSHSFPRSPFVPLLFSLFVMTRPKFSSILSPFLAFFFFFFLDKAESARSHSFVARDCI